LGLAVCHGIVTAHGGTIQVEDRSPRGAVLKVTLPIRVTATEERTS
jgi:K+-sensing histidine kinase KdpD